MVAIAIGRDYLNYLADPHPASLKLFEGLLLSPCLFLKFLLPNDCILGIGVE
jgi:hypothetical protein